MLLLYAKMEEDRARLEKEIQNTKRQLHSLPKGSFYYVETKNHTKWYTRRDKKLHYITKDNLPLAQQLVLRKYLTQHLHDLERALAPICAYLQQYNKEKPKAPQLFEDPEYAKLLSPQIQPLFYTLRQWATESYPQNTKHPETKIHHVANNLFVRSKSEAMIASRLLLYDIPFRYECPLCLSPVTLYPDFTIRHPRTGQTYYWEHLGMMEQEDYKRFSTIKMQHYIDANIIPGEQLILTRESANTPLTLPQIDKTLRQFFLYEEN